MEEKLDVPLFSPELKVWKSPLNHNLLMSGGIGIDPLLIEPNSNYPRFNMIVDKSGSSGNNHHKKQKDSKLSGGSSKKNPRRTILLFCHKTS